MWLKPVVRLIRHHKHRSPRETTFPEIRKRPVCVLHRVARHLDLELKLAGEAHKRRAIFSREIGDRTDPSLLPQEIVGKGRDLAHMNSAADDDPAFDERFKRDRHQSAHRGEDQRSVKFGWRRFIATPGPLRAAAKRELLCRRIARAREGVDRAPLVTSDLSDDMRGSAKPVNAYARGVAGHLQRAVADDACAQQRCRFCVRVSRWQMQTITAIGDGLFCITAVDRVARETGVVTQILPMLQAVAAMAAGMAPPPDRPA
jgi:hypothetical protein